MAHFRVIIEEEFSRGLEFQPGNQDPLASELLSGDPIGPIFGSKPRTSKN
ncbi:hypothetical protein SAMN06296036_12528 [Pseudobacteriovorax antillogorgiicola]|uniref:Uncharacterized protein n=1 Tax=Pseudobacteriovorax antillogorgiicola TaxID=1513793 RepID=A0A1Y6CJV0_9BACT|nr:hypothetical protein EDD56_12528 [Pseudobacteriovorax antillogorgiicola]SMF69590.1 hypothetical protein SAMN06296036_12528 [Pseudobacteriovorax antillogorgiicola]